MKQPKVAKAVAAPALEDESKLYKSTLSVDEKVAIATSVGEEVLMPEELRALFAAKEHPIVYDGFEPSGRMVSKEPSVFITFLKRPFFCLSSTSRKVFSALSM